MVLFIFLVLSNFIYQVFYNFINFLAKQLVNHELIKVIPEEDISQSQNNSFGENRFTLPTLTSMNNNNEFKDGFI